MKTFEGLCGIKATVVCDSISEAGTRLTTFEVEYPRIIHAELLTHKMLSRNAASSRAIPFAKMKEQLTGRPVRFGANVSGMQDDAQEHDGLIQGSPIFKPDGDYYTECYSSEEAWEFAKADALFWSQAFSDAGYHKQCFNRLTETFQMIKVLITATEWSNFFWLRNDSAADPTLHNLAKTMLEAYKDSVPRVISAYDMNADDVAWHLPYIEIHDNTDSLAWKKYYFITNAQGHPVRLSTQEAIKVSAARCAAISFRNSDYDLEKSLLVYDRLVGDERKHSSAMEHQATPILPVDGYNKAAINWQKGISHMDRDGNLWSGNFKNWIQHRKLIDGENYVGEIK